MHPAPTKTASNKPGSSFWVAALLTLSGGFLDAFTFVSHGQVFANSMTGNVVFVGIFTATGQLEQAMRHVPPIVAFFLGVFVAHVMRMPGIRRHMHQPALSCLCLEIVFLAGGTFLPESFPDLLLVSGIAFVAAMQSSSFTHLETWAYSSVMTTGNLRRCAEALFAGTVPTHNAAALRQSRVFALICLCFLAGAVGGALTTPRLHNLALWIPVAMLLGALALCAQETYKYAKPL